MLLRCRNLADKLATAETLAGGVTAARQWFAEDIRAVAPVIKAPAIIQAFATIPREAFLGAGPWLLHPRAFDRPARISPSADPQHVYHDVLISIDDTRGLNNGLPSLWAYYFDHLNLHPGQTVLQVGAGVGYFTAILAHLVGRAGRVIAYEIDRPLASRAAANLVGYPQVEVIHGDAVTAADLPPLDAIAVFAGSTHAPSHWLSAMAPGGRMVLPLTAADQWGIAVLLERQDQTITAATLGRCGFYPCASARTPDEEIALGKALAKSSNDLPVLRSYLMEKPEDQSSVWYAGTAFWLTKAEAV